MAQQFLYTAKLQAGLGLIPETKTLLQLWEPEMSVQSLYRVALDSGLFPNVTARRLLNIVRECFAHRYLKDGGAPARHLKLLLPSLGSEELQQLCLLFTCRANPILADFIREIYWTRYAAGEKEIRNEVAQDFIRRAIDDGKTVKRWSDSTVKRIAGGLTGCCADYGLLENGVRRKRRFLSVRLTKRVGVYLAYDLHHRGVGDGALLQHLDWGLFGMTSDEVLAELKRLSLNNWFMLQAGGEVVRISWKYPSVEELCHVLSEG